MTRALAVFLLVASAHADTTDPRRAAVCVQVGSRAVTVGEVEDRMAQSPPYQLRTLGATDAEIRRAFVDQVILPEALWSLGASAHHMDRQVPTRFDLARVRAEAALRALRTRLGGSAGVSMDDVRAYYDAHKEHYDAPERYQLWHIVCATKEEAQTVLAAAKHDPSVAAWSKLARDHSLDKATYLRSGNVGFVAPDGTSNEAGLKVDPAIVRAAATVHDGDFVPDPVAEGSSWSVVWRRGTVGASHQTVDDAKEQIQRTILREREADEKKKLLVDLRAKNLKEYNPELLTGIDVAPPDGIIVPRKRPGTIAPGASK